MEQNKEIFYQLAERTYKASKEKQIEDSMNEAEKQKMLCDVWDRFTLEAFVEADKGNNFVIFKCN